MFPVPRRPHDTRVSGGVVTLAGSTETMMLTSGDQRVWLQGGRVYDEAGVDLTDTELPGWVNIEWQKLTPEMQATHPLDGSAPQGRVNIARQSKIAELRAQLAQLETDEINSGAGTKIGEGSVTGQAAQPIDETDEEHLNKLTKQQILDLAADEELEGISSKMSKEDMVAAVLEARQAKASDEK